MLAAIAARQDLGKSLEDPCIEDEFAREKRADSSFRYKCTQVRSLLETGVDAWFERRFRVLFAGGGGHHSDFHANLS